MENNPATTTMGPLHRPPGQGTISCMAAPTGPRIGLVLSAGGLRGASHLGVIRQLARNSIPTDIIVGTSAGAVIAAYYAAVGLTVDEMLDDARVFRGRHLVAHSLASRSWQPLKPLFRPWSGVIPDRLARLRSARFNHLHHGVQALGVVCHDVTNDRPRYVSTASDGGLGLYEAVAASASIPSMFPTQPVQYEGRVCQLTDGGVSDALPVDFASQPGLEATHTIVSDCRQHANDLGEDARRVYLRPKLGRTTTLRAPRASLLEAVEAGEATITESVLARLRSWVTEGDAEQPGVRHQ